MERLTNVGNKGEIYITDNDDTRNIGRKEAAYKKLKEYEDLEEQGLLLRLPCKVGDTVYRICPKCNNNHNGSCENCAWRFSAKNVGCDIYGLWKDGQYRPDKCTIVSYKVTWNYIPNLLEHMNKTVFLTCEEAEAALQKMKNNELQKEE